MPLRSHAFSGATSVKTVTVRPAPPVTLGAALQRWVGQVLSFTIGFAVVGGLLVLIDDGSTAVAQSGETHAWKSRDRVAVLVARHHCWRGSAPEDAGIPGHAVVTLPGERARRVPADVGFAIWLDHKRGIVHAFCP